MDALSGETIAYQYDQLKRLTSASSTPNTGSSVSPWTQTYQYDGFGNLTAKVLNGTATTIAVNAATNRLANSNYDLNGNMLTGVGATFTYDEANRVQSATEVSGGTEYFGYAPDNKLVYRNTASGQEEEFFYGAYGEKLLSSGNPSVWFAGQLIWDAGNWVFQDRVGTVRGATLNYYGAMEQMARYYPYGDEITSTTNERTKFGTYYRDSFTGVDYADQRYYASAYGRFLTTDPTGAGVTSRVPASWNLYSYGGGDPANNNDPTGMFPCGAVDAFVDDGDNSDLSNGCGYALPFPNAAIIKYVVACPGYGIGVSFLPNQTCATFFPEQNAPPPTPTCEQTETAFVSSYLSKYNSPLAAYAGWIVTQSDLYGIDDRFIVALAGRETSYGTNPLWNSTAAGIYNVFSNSQHCASVGVLSFCKKVNPYPSYGAAISDVISTISASPYYQGLQSSDDIYDEYNLGGPGGPDKLLDVIYGGTKLQGNLANVRFARCP